MKKNKENLYNLYSDQLYLAYNSFEEARNLDKRGRYDKILRPKYVFLMNDFLELGERKFNDKEFEEASRAYEYALRINKSSFLDLPLDTNLLYNASLSAYKSKNRKDAIKYLNELNAYKYSSNVPHLLFSIYITQSDTVSACRILKGGIKNYEDNEDLVLLLADLSFKRKGAEKAVEILDEAFCKDSSNSTYPYTIGLLHQKTEDYKKAIDAFEIALSLPTDSLEVFTSIGACYYNMGAEIEEKARAISSNALYLEEREKSNSAYETALAWFEKAFEIDSNKQEIISKLYLLYEALDKKEKIEMLESRFK